MFLNSERNSSLLSNTIIAPNKKHMLKLIGAICIVGFVAVTNISHIMERRNQTTILATPSTSEMSLASFEEYSPEGTVYGYDQAYYGGNSSAFDLTNAQYFTSVQDILPNGLSSFRVGQNTRVSLCENSYCYPQS